jgi:uncharacterized protein YidB (DUF937 family)
VRCGLFAANFTEDDMSWLKAIAGGVIGAEALNLVKGYIEANGGIEGTINHIRSGGFSKKVDSWVSTGKNEAISAIEAGQIIGADKLKSLATKAGIDYDKARDLLAEYLPVAIDKATPDGKVPAPEKDETKKSLY